MEKFTSRKFIAFILVFVSAFVLKFLSKIDDLYFVILILTSMFIYTVVEGVIDLSSVKKVKTNFLEYEKDEKPNKN